MKVFVYGTLLNENLRIMLTGDFIESTPDILCGYRKVGLNVVPDEQSNVYGAIIYLKTIEQIKAIDTYESLGYIYYRKRITTNNKNRAYVYIRL